MNSYQPQQQQPQYRPNRAALWVNAHKTAANQPDYKGNLEISYALLQELQAAFNAGQYVQDRGGQPCIKLDLALYAQQGGVSASGKAKPILSGQLSTVAETQQSAALRQQAQAGQQQPQPQYVPQPQPQYQQPPQPAPQPQYAPQPVQPMPGAIHGQPPAAPSPMLPSGF